MDISSKKSRADLTAYFKRNSIPTAANFADFIGSTINQKDDGITKPPGDPISIEASTQVYKPALNIYEEFTDANPSWTLALASTSGNRGFAIGNVPPNQIGIETRFFIELATGNVGIGTVGPTDKLDVNGGVRALSASIAGATSLGSTLDVTGAVTAQSTVDVTGAVHVGGGITVVGAVSARSATLAEGLSTGSATVTNGISASTASITNALAAGSVTIAGAASAASATISGALSAGSAIVTNNVSAGSATVSGAISAQSAVVKGALQVATIAAQSDNATAHLLLAGKGTGGAVKATTALIADATVDITGKLTAGAGVEITGALNAKSTVDVTGKLTTAAIDVGGAMTANSTVDITGKLAAASGIDVRTVSRTNANDHPTGRPLYVTGAITNTQGVEFRTSDATQGIGFGPTTIYAAGTAATQDLVLAPKGPAEAPGILRVKSAAIIQGSLSVDSIAPQNVEANANLTFAAKGTGTIRLTSASVATSTLDVTGKVTANAALDVGGALVAKSTLDVTGKITAANALDVTGAFTARSTVEVTGKLTANAALDVSGAVTAKSTLEVTGKLTATGGMDLRGTARSNNDFHPTGRPLYVTGAMTNSSGIEFRTSDASQGIGFGPTTIYAAGTNATQDLVLAPKGTSDAPGKVSITASLNVNGTMTATKAAVQNAIEAGSGSISGLLTAASVKIGSQGATATSIVDTISASTPTTAIPTTSAMKSYVASVLPDFAKNLLTADDTDLATVSGVKAYVNRAIPIGSILMWKGAAIPEGWALCNGDNGTPNLADKFIFGKGAKTIGTTGGSETVRLTIDQIPAHNHSYHMDSAGNHSHEVVGYRADLKHAGGASESGLHDDGDGHMNPLPRTRDAGSHTHGLSINNAGGGGTHDNMPPYYVLAYIMRIS